MTDIVERLRRKVFRGPTMEASHTKTVEWEAADEIERLRKKCDTQATMLRSIDPERFPDTLFIHMYGGERDQNGMPERLYVVPAHGVDFSYVYTRTDKTIGPEW
jgi:hypothetical protein